MRMTKREIDHSERDRLVVAHIGLVKALAHRLAQRLPPQVEIPNLISIGVLGLMDAAGRYRAALGVPFDAFARRRVQGAMLDALRDLDWAPRSLRKMRRELDVALAPAASRAAARADRGRDRHDARHDARRVLDARSSSCERWSSAPFGRSTTRPEKAALLDLCFDPDDGPEVRLQRAELREHLARAIEKLPAARAAHPGACITSRR